MATQVRHDLNAALAAMRFVDPHDAGEVLDRVQTLIHSALDAEADALDAPHPLAPTLRNREVFLQDSDRPVARLYTDDDIDYVGANWIGTTFIDAEELRAVAYIMDEVKSGEVAL